MNPSRLPNRYPIFRTAIIVGLIIFSLPSLATLWVHGQSYTLRYDLGYVGVPYPGGAISVVNNFTNTGQLTVRVTSILFASDFWSNGTSQVTSGFPFNLTAGMNKMIDTTVLIPTSARTGNHTITATANWQYSDSSGWQPAAPTVGNVTVMVSQTIGSLFSSFATILLIGLGVSLVVAALVVFLVVRQRKKPKPSAQSPVVPPPNLKTL